MAVWCYWLQFGCGWVSCLIEYSRVDYNDSEQNFVMRIIKYENARRKINRQTNITVDITVYFFARAYKTLLCVVDG